MNTNKTTETNKGEMTTESECSIKYNEKTKTIESIIIKNKDNIPAIENFNIYMNLYFKLLKLSKDDLIQKIIVLFMNKDSESE